MVVYNFKKIAPVPTSKDFVDVVLSKTQRQTPTVIHKQYAIGRIRSFYMRKVKFTQSTYEEKIARILDEFPRLNDIHPFYADLMNVLYDKDHYKLALGQLNMARGLIDRLGKDYLRLLKFGDSLYRCKQLKRAALGRMCTLMRKLKSSLEYLEQVRQHLARLPSIDPNTRTLLICGYPNVGKSSFMNKVTRADVEVQPYAFTTKSLFVGHTDYKYLRWQVIDTPGILDHSLEERNTIEMQSVTALVHLKAAVLYFVDLSEQCGFSIKEQVSLFHNIKPLFEGKPLVVVLNKSDVRTLDQCTADEKAMIATLQGTGVSFITCSTLTEEGVAGLKAAACDLLLEHRVSSKVARAERAGKEGGTLGQIHVAIPIPRDRVKRPPVIPDSVTSRLALGETLHTQRKLQKEVMNERGGAGVYSAEFREQYTGLRDEEWRFDTVPEIMDGKNIMDFVDPDIEELLERLDREEEEREARGEYDEDEDEDEGLTEVERTQLSAIRRKRATLRFEAAMAKSANHPHLPRTVRANRRGDLSLRGRSMDEHLEELGFDEETGARKRARALSSGAAGAAERRGRSRERRGDKMEAEGGEGEVAWGAAPRGEGMDVDETGTERARKKLRALSKERSSSRGRSQVLPSHAPARSAGTSPPFLRAPSLVPVVYSTHSRCFHPCPLPSLRCHHPDRLARRAASHRLTPRPQSVPRDEAGHAYKDKEQQAQAKKIAVKKVNALMRVKGKGTARKGEADRHIPNLMPKHLYSGKRGNGKTDRR
jgi:nucleolar GTP-binding protein